MIIHVFEMSAAVMLFAYSLYIMAKITHSDEQSRIGSE